MFTWGIAQNIIKILLKRLKILLLKIFFQVAEVYKKRKYYRKYPYKFESGPAKLFLFHTEPELTLKTIIGQENFQKFITFPP